jgi:hypothetical protein
MVITKETAGPGRPVDRPAGVEDELSEFGWIPDGRALPRLQAVENLAAALVRGGMRDGAARSLARSAVNPDDARRRLGEPAKMRVQGGTLFVIETRLWTPGVVPYPTNPRELGHRAYPLGLPDVHGAEGLIPDPVQSPGRSAELTLRLSRPEDLAHRLRDAEVWLRDANPLVEDVAVEGILQPLAVVILNVEHNDGASPLHLLAAADGSSRTTAAHTLLKLDPAEVAYDLSQDERAFRQFIGRYLRLLRDRGWDGLSNEEQQRVRALITPARVVIGFEPEPGRSLTFDGAVRNLIGLTHIRPPRAYGAPVENEAKADAVLDALARPLLTRPAHITPLERMWFSGLMTRTQAENAGLPPYPDIRASDITRALLHGGRATVRRVNQGIRSLTAKQQPSPNERVDIAVELILRPLKTERAAEKGYSIAARRAALQRAYRLPEIAQQNDAPIIEGFSDSEFTLEDLHDLALQEVEAGHGDDGGLESAQVELATKAAYYMIVAEPMALRREGYGGDENIARDERALSVVLRAMLSRRRGVHQAYAVIRAGRAGEPLFEVDEDGVPVLDARHRKRVLTDDLVRAAYTNRPVTKATTGAAGAARRWAEIVDSTDRLQRAVEELQRVRGDRGNRFVDERGWPNAQVRPVRDQLDRISRTLAAWADRYEEVQHDLQEEEASEEASE